MKFILIAGCNVYYIDLIRVLGVNIEGFEVVENLVIKS